MVEIRIEKRDENTIEVELEGESHTLPNLIRKELWNDPTVTLAAYTKDHPYIGIPRLIVSAENPEKALLDAISRAKKQFEELEKKLKEALK